MNVDTVSIEILKMEYTQTYSKLIYLDDQANKYVNYILTTVAALAAFLALLIKDGNITDYITFSMLISAGTLIIGLLIIMTLHHTVQCFRLGGYIKYLEDQINKLANSKLLNWESEVAQKYVHKDITTFFIYSIMGLVFFILLISAAYVAIVYIFSQWPVISILILCLIILEIVTGFVYVNKIGTVHDKIYTLVTQQHEHAELNKEIVKAE